jgi:hypothetical protein
VNEQAQGVEVQHVDVGQVAAHGVRGAAQFTGQVRGEAFQDPDGGFGGTQAFSLGRLATASTRPAARWQSGRWYDERPATTVPDRIRAIASMRGAAQENAIDTLGNEICHQGSSYSSTAPTVPFLLEIVRQPQIPRRDRLVALLLTIAVGLDSDLLYDQTKLSEYIAKQERDAAGWPKSRPRPVSWGPFIWLECYSSVRRAVPTLIRLLDDRSRGVRIHTAYLLAWFPSECHKSLPPLRRLMKAARRWDELANAILSVGLLEWQASVRSRSRTFVRPLLDDRREAVRYAAAVVL